MSSRVAKGLFFGLLLYFAPHIDINGENLVITRCTAPAAYIKGTEWNFCLSVCAPCTVVVKKYSRTGRRREDGRGITT
jgi:hypothetical protein